ITRFWTLSIGLRQHGEHGDAPPLRSPRNGSSPIATSLARWIASERSATLEGEPVDLHGPFEGRRTRSCLGRRGLPRVSRADQVGAAVLFEAMPILGLAGAFHPSTTHDAAHCAANATEPQWRRGRRLVG